MFPPEKIARRICLRHQVVIVQPAAVELDLELEPLAQSHRGFDSRLPPIPSSMSVDLNNGVHLGKEYAGKFLKAHGVAKS